MAVSTINCVVGIRAIYLTKFFGVIVNVAKIFKVFVWHIEQDSI